MTTFVALGDSITLGIGDPVRLAPPPGRSKGMRAWRGWAVLLAETLADPALHIVAGNGALMADLERDQLPAALQLRPDVASVINPGNSEKNLPFRLDNAFNNAEVNILRMFFKDRCKGF